MQQVIPRSGIGRWLAPHRATSSHPIPGAACTCSLRLASRKRVNGTGQRFEFGRPRIGPAEAIVLWGGRGEAPEPAGGDDRSHVPGDKTPASVRQTPATSSIQASKPSIG
jgi:hypothetical protein